MDCRTWNELTVVEQLQTTYSDFYKEVYGVRPRFMTTEEWNSEEFLNGAIADLHRYMDEMKATKEGRNQLRDEGWYIESPSAAEDGWVERIRAEELAEEEERARLQAEQCELEAAYDDRYDHLVK